MDGHAAHSPPGFNNYTLEQFANDGRRTGRKIDGKQQSGSRTIREMSLNRARNF